MVNIKEKIDHVIRWGEEGLVRNIMRLSEK